MRRMFKWQVFLGLSLIILSSAVYLVHYIIFRDAHHIFLYLIGDIAFVFFEVLLVTLVLHQLLHHREKKNMLNKLNMVIGAFFSEVGTELLKSFSDFDKDGKADRLEVVEYFKSKGFFWGGDWKFKDKPHFEMTFGHTWRTLKNDYDSGKTFTEVINGKTYTYVKI